MYTNTYPIFEEIKEEILKQDLMEIIESAISLYDGNINLAIQDYIEAEYELVKEFDYDYAYDSYKDNLLTA
ncbi:hypothetical protein Arnit_0628 [Arcobacter nitrofigilis DSM 7299]|uniref:Uncharacterized protein n=1 Tax=Arcobacter nitrofigilis (strain ATCC 33309 / DSM 7299 / CCUG 15893 / LMG 7604 / NCTC 12251 / CI) TaxID=572480 RepID=D5V260_ARCNC|nr:hypothetical protein [Arcobacter nitrofigilis]ADG92293.1 hypothetical protein Arnit_0628 [Arcobacter nitrofigilis DSM 7299]